MPLNSNWHKQLYAGNSGTNTLLRAIYGRTYDPVFGSHTLTIPAREATTGRRTLCIPPHNARVNPIGAASPDSAGISGSGSGGDSGGSDNRTDSEEHYYMIVIKVSQTMMLLSHSQIVMRSASIFCRLTSPIEKKLPIICWRLILIVQRHMLSVTIPMLHMRSIALYVEDNIVLRTALCWMIMISSSSTTFASVRMFAMIKQSFPNREESRSTSWTSAHILTTLIVKEMTGIFCTAATKFVAALPCKKRQIQKLRDNQGHTNWWIVFRRY